MLNKTYQRLIVIGICIGVTAGIFFLCMLQNQIASTAQANEVRRRDELNGRIYVTLKDPGENALFSLGDMKMEAYEEIAALLPKDWIWAPVAALWESEVSANETQIAGTEVLYSTAQYLTVNDTSLLEGSFNPAGEGCMVNEAFMTEYGLSLSDAPSVTVNGEALPITGVFQTPPESRVSDLFQSLGGTGPQLVASFAHYAEKGGETLRQIILQKPEGLTLSQFEEQLARLQEACASLPVDTDRTYRVCSDAALYTDVNRTKDTLPVYLGIFLMTLLGEFVAGLNVMHLASAGILDNRRSLGLRLAVGASYGNLFREFLWEIVALCGKGALLGLAASSVLVFAVNRFMNQFSFLFDAATVGMSVAVILSVSFLAAYFPFRAVLRQQPARLHREGDFSVRRKKSAWLQYFLIALVFGLQLAINAGVRAKASSMTVYVTVLLGLFSAGVVAVCLIGMLGILLTHIQQNKSAVGLHRAVGAGSLEVVRLVVWEYTLKQAILPVVLGSAAAQLAVASGLLRGIGFPLEVNLSYAAAGLLLTLLCLTLTALYPALMAVRIDPVKALRGEQS